MSSSVQIKGEKGKKISICRASTGIGERFTIYIGTARIVLTEKSADDLVAYLADLLDGQYMDRMGKDRPTISRRRVFALPKKARR